MPFLHTENVPGDYLAIAGGRPPFSVGGQQGIWIVGGDHTIWYAER